MSQAESIAILRDVFLIGALAFAAAALLYKGLRRWGDAGWNLEGNVLTRPYGPPDLVATTVLLSIFGTVFFVDVAAASPVGGAGGIQEELTLSSLALQTLSMLFLCLLVLGYLTALRGLNPAEIFGLRQMSVQRAFLHAVPSLILTVLGIWMVMAVVLALTGGELPDTSSQETVEAFQKSRSLPFRLMLGFVAVVTAPLTEELLFRGFLYGVVKRYTDRWFAACFTAVMFAVVHFHVGTAPQLFLLGVGLAVAYEHTGCLLVPVFMHAMFNAWNVLVLTLHSAFSWS